MVDPDPLRARPMARLTLRDRLRVLRREALAQLTQSDRIDAEMLELVAHAGALLRRSRPKPCRPLRQYRGTARWSWTTICKFRLWFIRPTGKPLRDGLADCSDPAGRTVARRGSSGGYDPQPPGYVRESRRSLTQRRRI